MAPGTRLSAITIYHSLFTISSVHLLPAADVDRLAGHVVGIV
jgi:hypothetical protein